nr:MAPEG family protein [Pseudomonas sp. Marseille-Q3773]
MQVPAGETAAAVSVVFTIARIWHTLAYLKGVQPWRTVFYAVGILCLLGLCAAVMMSVKRSCQGKGLSPGQPRRRSSKGAEQSTNTGQNPQPGAGRAVLMHGCRRRCLPACHQGASRTASQHTKNHFISKRCRSFATFPARRRAFGTFIAMDSIAFSTQQRLIESEADDRHRTRLPQQGRTQNM